MKGLDKELVCLSVCACVCVCAGMGERLFFEFLFHERTIGFPNSVYVHLYETHSQKTQIALSHI